jgi:hypothetical protein
MSKLFLKEWAKKNCHKYNEEQNRKKKSLSGDLFGEERFAIITL